MSNIGNRIYTDFERPSKDILEQFRGIPSSNINDEMNRLYCMHDYIRPFNDVSLLGPAFTVKVPNGDNLMIHQALDMAQPGDILVVDGGSGNNRSLMGEIMLRYAIGRGIAGVVIDGCLRDLDAIKKLDIAVYGKGITPQGPWKNGPGEINVPVSVGGQVVFPGDILVGDADGIVVIRPQDAAIIAEKAQKKKKGEDDTFELQKTDFEAYTRKHFASTAKRMEGKNPEIKASYAEDY